VYFTASAEPHAKGDEGTAITLVSYGEMSNFNSIKALTKTKIGRTQGHSNCCMRRFANTEFLLKTLSLFGFFFSRLTFY